MNAHESRSRLRRPQLTSLLLTLLAALVVGFGLASSTAQSPQESPAQSEEEERKFENTIPAHVPIKVKLKNEQSFKNPKNKDWAKELEIEVKNTGTKPIYLLMVTFNMPDFTLEDGHSVVFGIRYGRKELIQLDAPLLPDDVPIQPGETITMMIPENQTRGYQNVRDGRNKADAKKIEFELQFINFGDGTGLEMPPGVPAHNPNRRRSQNSQPPQQGDSVCQPPPRLQAAEPPATFLKASYPPEPANFLRVDFYSRRISRHSPRPPAPATARTFLIASTGNRSARIIALAITTARLLPTSRRGTVATRPPFVGRWS